MERDRVTGKREGTGARHGETRSGGASSHGWSLRRAWTGAAAGVAGGPYSRSRSRSTAHLRQVSGWSAAASFGAAAHGVVRE